MIIRFKNLLLKYKNAKNVNMNISFHFQIPNADNDVRNEYTALMMTKPVSRLRRPGLRLLIYGHRNTDDVDTRQKGSRRISIGNGMPPCRRAPITVGVRGRYILFDSIISHLHTI